jgi:hypothetical protein
MNRFISAILCLLFLVSCGGLKNEDKNASSPSNLKITAQPAKISFQTEPDDPGTWQEDQVIIQTFKTVSGKDTPVEGKVRVTSLSEYVRVFDENNHQVTSGSTVTAKNGLHVFRVQYLTRANPPVAYESNIVFQYQSAASVVPVEVKEPPSVNYSLTAIPNKIEHKSSANDTGTWNTANILLRLFAESDPLEDNVSIFIRNGQNIRVYDTLGSQIASQGTIRTDSDGQALFSVSYFTSSTSSYTDSIELSYRTTSTSIPINVTPPDIQIVKTYLTPEQFTYKAPNNDIGTWRQAFFNVYTKDSNDNFLSNAKVNLATSSQFTKLICGNTETSECTVQTNQSGIYTASIKFYTQSLPHRNDYSAHLIANEAISTLNISGSDPDPVTTYTVNISPAQYTYTHTGTDAGTWRSQYFIVVVTDNKNNVIPDAEISVIAPYPDYTKLYDISGQEIASPMTVRTDAGGQYDLRVDYFTQADFSTTPATKLTYSGQLVVAHKQFSKTVVLTVQ